MAKLTSRLTAVFFVLVFAVGYSARPRAETVLAKPQDLLKKPFTVCGTKLSLEIANDPEKRSIGLMHRKEVKSGTGMLFEFNYPQVLEFWMRNVDFDIDIGYFDAHGHLLKHYTMLGTSELMKDDALPRYTSLKAALFAVETKAGFFTDARSKNCVMSPVPSKSVH